MLALVIPCNDASLGKTIHPLLNFYVDPAIRSDNVVKVVMNNDFSGDDVKMERHVLGVWHGGVEEEIGEVDTQKLASGVLMVELMSSLAVVRLAIGVLLLPG
jgi:hypothetical protein